MNKTTFRKVGLGSCMFLTFLSGMPIGMSTARAQTTGTQTTTGTGTTMPTGLPISNTELFSSQATTAVTGVLNGSTTIATAAQQLAANSVTGVSATSLQGVLTSMMSGSNINPQAAIGLLGGVMSGAVSSDLASNLLKNVNLGNITNLADLQKLLGGASGLINQLGLGGLSTALTAALGPTGAALLNNPAVTSAISNLFPGLTTSLGGTAGLQTALTNLGTQLAGTAGGIIGGLIGGLLSGGNVLAGVSTAGGTLAPICSPNQPCAGIHTDYQEVRDHVSSQFQQHRAWFITNYWKENILPALMLMAEQLTVAGVVQVEVFGTFLDAKHQLETQRLFQELTAQAHKDYQPSEGMCTFGTTVRSLAASERKSDITQMAFAQRMTQRQAMSGDVTSVEGVSADIRSRLQQFITTYCDQADDANGLSKLCPSAVPTASRRNIDVDYTRNIESRLTLDLDFAPTDTAATADTTTETPDAQDVFALSANLYSHNVAPRLQPELFGDGKGKVRMSVAEKYMDLRAVFAKRSVAQNSFAAMTAMRAAGDDRSAPYTKRLIQELGVTDTADIEKLLGKKPSYFAQMEVLTKKLYQNPTFYTELYDKPVNVERKGAALQAIGLMQDRDLYNSLLRSEAVLSVLLETMLQKEQEKVTNDQNSLGRSGGSQ